MNWLQLLLAPLGVPIILAGYWFVKNARRAAEATIKFESRSPTAKWVRPPNRRDLTIDRVSYKALGIFFMVGGTLFSIVNLLFAFSVITPSN